MQVAPRLRSATRSRVAEEAISISNFVKWYDTVGDRPVFSELKFHKMTKC
ncbi:hypothetical protein [Aulosira sp. FACHB-615]|nr:hypothetical protein [Aulosira sp. FACHB-615]MBD2489544.1 hypothetical protein [Aulosira sp. FACHB-615]